PCLGSAMPRYRGRHSPRQRARTALPSRAPLGLAQRLRTPVLIRGSGLAARQGPRRPPWPVTIPGHGIVATSLWRLLASMATHAWDPRRYARAPQPRYASSLTP